MAKKNPHVAFSQQNGITQFTFAHGPVVPFDIRAVLPDYDDLPKIAQDFVDYGVKQKLADSMALPADEATPERKHEALVEMIEAIAGGKFTLRGEGMGGSLFAQALSAVRGITLEEARNRISAKVKEIMAANPEMKDRAALDALRAAALTGDTALKAEYARLQADRAAKKTAPTVDATGL